MTDDANTYAVIDELEARVPGLSEGKWYQFRVIAVNKAGESWPSVETKPHLCRHKNRTLNKIKLLKNKVTSTSPYRILSCLKIGNVHELNIN